MSESTGDLNTLPPQKRTALLDAIGALCGVFWGPDTNACRAIRDGVFFQPFEALAGTVIYNPPDILDQVKNAVGGFDTPGDLFPFLESAYVRLFVSHREGITAPLYASCYASENPGLMGPPARDMTARLRAQGVNLSGNIHEPPDHVAIELEYLYLLLKKGWSEGKPELLTAAVAFAADTMGPWVADLASRLSGENRCRFYPLAVRLMMSILHFVGATRPEHRR